MKTPSQYRQIIATELRKKDLYEQRQEIANTLFGKYMGLSELSISQLSDFLNHIQKGASVKVDKKDCIRMRKAILHKMHLMGYILQNEGVFNYDRMNDFIRNIGSNNPKKKLLHQLSYSELQSVTTQINQMYKKETYGNNKA